MFFQQFLERIGGDLSRPHQPLHIAFNIGDQDYFPAGRTLGVESGEKIETQTGYSTFSTKTRMVPPQESPTFHAVSSAMPNSSILGLPLSITSAASATTAPSTQPPETEPRKLP